jgi:hypothetical protein
MKRYDLARKGNVIDLFESPEGDWVAWEEYCRRTVEAAVEHRDLVGALEETVEDLQNRVELLEAEEMHYGMAEVN